MNIEILKDGAVYVGGVLDQELTKKNRAFYHQKLSALLEEIVEEMDKAHDSCIHEECCADKSFKIIEAKK